MFTVELSKPSRYHEAVSAKSSPICKGQLSRRPPFMSSRGDGINLRTKPQAANAGSIAIRNCSHAAHENRDRKATQD